MEKLIPFLYMLLFAPFCLTGQNNLLEHYSREEGVPQVQVYDMTVAPDGTPWFATSQGILIFNGLSFQRLGDQGLNNESILGFYNNSHKIGCFSSENTIYFYGNGSFHPLPVNRSLKNILSNKIINSITAEGKDIWISTVIAADLLKIESGADIKKINMDSLGDFSYYIRRINNEAFIWGSYKNKKENNILKLIDAENDLEIVLSRKGGYSKSRFIQLQDGTYLFAKSQEIIQLSNDKVITRTFVEKNIEDIFQDSEGKLWAGLYTGGAICFPDGNLSSGGMIKYLGDKTVTSIGEDHSGNIWLTTMNNGIYSLPGRPELTYSQPRIFSKTDHSKIEEVKEPVVTKTVPATSDNPFFRVISTDTVRYDTIPPSIYISGLQILGKDTLVQNNYRLPHNKNFVTIQFVGFAYNNPEMLRYKYKLTGINKEWIYTNNPFAQYTTLPPGNYNFFVSSMNKKGYWSETPASLSFTILPPFWRTWWFITVAIAVAVTVMLLSAFLWVRQVKKKEREKAAVNKKIADMELQALRSQMNPHFIFNTLSSIQHYITTNNTKPALKYLSKFAQLMRCIMENSKNPVIPVKDELNTLQLYLDLESLRFKNKFTYKLEVDPEVDTQYDEIPAMLIQPFVENAILHGIMHKEGKGEINISMIKNNGTIVCTIKDNGIGREKAKAINNLKHKKHKSRGMSITKDRLEILSKEKNHALNINITDLTDNKGASAGTCVELYIPIEKL